MIPRKDAGLAQSTDSIGGAVGAEVDLGGELLEAESPVFDECGEQDPVDVVILLAEIPRLSRYKTVLYKKNEVIMPSHYINTSQMRYFDS